MEKRLLQIAVALAGLVPVAAGLIGAWRGAAMLGASMSGHWADPALDSHVRYLSGLLLGVGLAFWSTIPDIERRGAQFRLLTLLVITGGLCRALGVALHGSPGRGMDLALVMELGVTPGLYLWRLRVAGLAAAPAPMDA